MSITALDLPEKITVYTVYTDNNLELAMSAPTSHKPTKKAVDLAKNSNTQEVDSDAQVAVAEQSPAADPVSTRKASKTKRAAASKSEDTTLPVDEKPRRSKKEKVVRDSFTMPKSDYDKIAALKQRCLDAGVSVKKSELLRAGLIMLEAAASKRLLAAVTAVEAVKTGRPAKA
ncbi:conserved hypothetical protein [Paraburkholderia ribeironis]|uniref:Uncharacterized protein n=2 Tax=Paraburkholderia ribeironis TaxID=1247936 RepID=A0A1N7S7J5_9BURK|nr:conserved hypothetical protein [Paraburkholderia ribeironis]